jgi:hypothetical protein
LCWRPIGASDLLDNELDTASKLIPPDLFWPAIYRFGDFGNARVRLAQRHASHLACELLVTLMRHWAQESVTEKTHRAP